MFERGKDIEEVVEQKVEERMEEERQRIREEVKEELKQEALKNRSKNAGDSEKEGREKEQGISRRSFLKKLGLGAAGLGALSLAPAASKVTVGSQGVYKDGNEFYHEGVFNYPFSSGDLGDGSITSTQIAEDAVTSTEIGSSEISADHLSFDTATQTELDNQTHTLADITDFESDSGTIYVQSSTPSNPSINDIWIDTS